MWVGKFSIFEKQGNDQCGWSPERRGESDVTWSRCGGRSQGWPTFLSLCTAPFSFDVCSSQAGGPVVGSQVCRPACSSRSGSGLLPVLRSAPWPSGPVVGLQDFLLGVWQPLSAETRAVLTQRFWEPGFSHPGDLVSSSCTACDPVSQ